MQLIVKSAILDKCVTHTGYKIIDLDDKGSMVKPSDINIGFGSRALITDLKKKDGINNSLIAKFLTECIVFVVTILKKLFDKSPAGSNVVRNASICVLQKRLNKLLSHLMKLNILSTTQCDKITEQYNEFTENQVKLNLHKFQSFTRYEMDLDDF